MSNTQDDMLKVQFLMNSRPSERKLEKSYKTRHIARWKMKKIAEDVARCGSVEAAAKMNGVSGASVRAEMYTHADSKDMIHQAMADATGMLERSVYKRATKGVTIDGKVIPPSDKLAISWLKAHKPEVYGEHKSVSVSGDVRMVHAVNLTDEQLMAIAAQGGEVVDAQEPLEEKTNKIK